MTRVVGTSVDASFLYQNAQLEKIEKTLNHSILSPSELHSVSKQLDELKERALAADSKETYQSLCGRVHTKGTNNFVDAIVEESDSLCTGKYSSSEDLAERVNVLKEAIVKVGHDNTLSIENLRYIKIAENNLSHVLPSSKIDDMIRHPQVNFMRSDELPAEDDGEIAIDLCEMAELFYRNNFDEGLRKFNQLPQTVKGRLEDHCLVIGAELITKNREPQNSIRFIRAVWGFATELGRGEFISYPSVQELRFIFDEADNYSSEKTNLPLQ